LIPPTLAKVIDETVAIVVERLGQFPSVQM